MMNPTNVLFVNHTTPPIFRNVSFKMENVADQVFSENNPMKPG